MAIVDVSMNGDSVPSSRLDSINANSGEDAPSPNDLAWADSLLNFDLVSYDTNWSSFKNALSEIPSFQSGQLHSAAAENYTQPSTSEDLSFKDYVASLTFTRGGSDDDEDLTDDGSEDIESSESSDDDEGNPMTTNKRVKKRIQNVFRPHYTEESEDIVNVEFSETDSDMGDDIFKVWDLGISEEQDDFAKQLEKVFADFAPQIERNPDDSTALKDDVMHVSVDDLIAFMGDLSLSQTTT